MKTHVVDLSHYDPATDYTKVGNAGVMGVIYKATQGSSYHDPTYIAQAKLADGAALLWGSYHFGDGSPVQDQIENYVHFAQPAPTDLFCLDFEDNGDNSMSLEQAKAWVTGVENELQRYGQCVIYTGNRFKDLTDGKPVDPFWSQRRLWLAQYAATPVVPPTWAHYWLWQWTDSGPVDGIGKCDCSQLYWVPPANELADEWSGSKTTPIAVPPVNITISGLPAGTKVNLTIV
jgi:lysozyme